MSNRFDVYFDTIAVCSFGTLPEAVKFTHSLSSLDSVRILETDLVNARCRWHVYNGTVSGAKALADNRAKPLHMGAPYVH